MKIFKGSSYIFFLLFILALPSNAQVPVERSSEKVVIAGTQYYIHTVKKGQTAYSITRAYGISLQELDDSNPSAAGGIKEGQVLRIPVKQQSASVVKVSQSTSKDESRFVYHSLKAGETIYSLSRMYGVSEAEIMQSNPGIEINKLSVGSEIAVPRREFMAPREKFSVQEQQKYILHKVEKGETLSSIARKYKITLRELRKENRNVRFPQVGDYIRIPSTVTEQEPVVAEVLDSVPVQEEVIEKPLKPEGYTNIGKLEGDMDIAVLLPFFLPENSSRTTIDSSVIVKGKKQYRINNVSDDWIYPQSLDFVEMYNGILMAADTLRSHGLDITLHTFDIKGDTMEVHNLITSGGLENMDLIIGPVYSRSLYVVSRYAGKMGIPVVSPVSLINNNVLTGNPTTFMANSSLEVAQKALASEIGQFNNSNIVFIHTDSARIDPDVTRYRSFIFNELNNKMNYENIRFKELIFYPRSSFGNDSINRISHSLSDNGENIVIIASEDPPVVSEILTIVQPLSRKFNLRVYGYPSMLYLLDNLDPRIFFDLDQVILSPYRIDYESPDVKQFNLNYLKKFLTMPLETSYAWIGYDIAYYFISGIALHGTEFVNHPEMHNPRLLQNEFIFERKSVDDGFENQKLFKIRYSKDYKVVF
ncbi:MAG TPA: LysM peptidoglycan-binding domain-containing protein [Bacteroidales bacterium]|nr:LysM peptidoglycan-binding domain-containing protein [Bacteroidales bacterium]